MEEEFKTIKGFENYSVSNLGNVKNDKTDRVMKQRNNKYGYKIVNFSMNGKKDTKIVHRLVAIAFIPNTDNKLTVDHIDNKRTNNNVDNLRWATKSEQEMNKGISSKNTSGIIGVHKTKLGNWEARYGLNGKKIYIGTYNTIEEAEQARIKKVNEVYGSFTNKVQKIKDDLDELEKEFEALLKS